MWSMRARLAATKNPFFGYAHRGPEVEAVELGYPDFVAVGDVHGLARILPAVLFDEVAHDPDRLAGGGAALEGDVLGVQQSISPRFFP